MFNPAKVLPIVYDEIKKEFGPDCCVSASGALQDILRDVYGMESEPLAVEVAIFNPYVTKKIQNLGSFPKDLDTLTGWVMSDKGWSVGVGQKDNGKASDGTIGLNGHLVLIVKDAEGVNALMDVSVGQASRPHKKMNLGPVWFEADDGFLKGELSAAFIKFGCLFSYKTITHNRDFRTSPDWRKYRRIDALKRIKKRLNVASPLRRA